MMNLHQIDYDGIAEQMRKQSEELFSEETVLDQIKETTEKTSKSSDKQGKLSIWIQVLTLITAVLTLSATVWFGIRG